MKSPIAEPSHGPRIGRVLVRSQDDFTARSNDTSKQLLDLLLGRVRIGSSVLLFQDRSFQSLRGPHRATSPKLRIVESVDEMGRTDQEIDVHGPVLTVFESSKTVEDKGFGGCLHGAMLLMKEKAIASQAIREASNCRVRDACLSSNLSKSRAGNEAMEDGFEEVASAEPVVRGKGL